MALIKALTALLNPTIDLEVGSSLLISLKLQRIHSLLNTFYSQGRLSMIDCVTHWQTPVKGQGLRSREFIGVLEVGCITLSYVMSHRSNEPGVGRCH